LEHILQDKPYLIYFGGEVTIFMQQILSRQSKFFHFYHQRIEMLPDDEIANIFCTVANQVIL
jgi:hypothetical protein